MRGTTSPGRAVLAGGPTILWPVGYDTSDRNSFVVSDYYVSTSGGLGWPIVWMRRGSSWEILVISGPVAAPVDSAVPSALAVRKFVDDTETTPGHPGPVSWSPG